MLNKLMSWPAIVVFLILLLTVGVVSAQSPANVMPEGLEGMNRPIPMICSKDARTMYNALKKTHNEEPVILGFSNSGPVAVVWFSDPARSTLSIVIDAPNESCMIFSTRCMPGDCFVGAEENHERQKDKMMPENDSPKVGT